MKKALTIILSIILVLLLGCIAYQLVNTNKEDIKDDIYEENEIKNLKVLLDESTYLTDNDKIDEDKPFIYEIAPVYEEEVVEGITEKNFKDEFKATTEMTGEYTVPYININIEDADLANKWFMQTALIVNQAKNSVLDKELTYMNYKIFTNDNIYSILVEGSIYGLEFKKAFNFDLESKKTLYMIDFQLKYTPEVINQLFNKCVDVIKNDEEHLQFNSIDANDIPLLFPVIDAENSIKLLDPIIPYEIKETNYLSKRKIYNDNKYIGYVLSIYDFINDDLSINESKLKVFVDDIYYNGYTYFLDENNTFNVYYRYPVENGWKYKLNKLK